MDICDFAMKMEMDGKEFYEKLAAQSPAEGLRKIFTELALDEQKHYEVFRKLKERATDISMGASSALDDAKNLFETMAPDQDLCRQLQSSLDGYRYAMEIEKKSVDFYLEAAAGAEDEKAGALLARIAEEERTHLRILENVYEFVNTPGHTLVWGEWSNLEDS